MKIDGKKHSKKIEMNVLVPYTSHLFLVIFALSLCVCVSTFVGMSGNSWRIFPVLLVCFFPSYRSTLELSTWLHPNLSAEPKYRELSSIPYQTREREKKGEAKQRNSRSESDETEIFEEFCFLERFSLDQVKFIEFYGFGLWQMDCLPYFMCLFSVEWIGRLFYSILRQNIIFFGILFIGNVFSIDPNSRRW